MEENVETPIKRCTLSSASSVFVCQHQTTNSGKSTSPCDHGRTCTSSPPQATAGSSQHMSKPQQSTPIKSSTIPFKYPTLIILSDRWVFSVRDRLRKRDRQTESEKANNVLQLRHSRNGRLRMSKNANGKEKGSCVPHSKKTESKKISFKFYIQIVPRMTLKLHASKQRSLSFPVVTQKKWAIQSRKAHDQ